MKKTLLLLLSFVAAMGMSAQTTISWKATSEWTGLSTAQISYKQDGFTIKAVKNNGQTNPTVNATALDARVYAKGTLTVSGKSLSQVVFNISTQGLARLAEITPSTGKLEVSPDHTTLTWTGDAASVDFTVGDKAVYGTDGATKGGQLCFSSLIITGEGSDDEGQGGGTVEGAITIAEAQQATGTATVVADVVAVGTQGVVLGDGTGYMYYYAKEHGLVIGDHITITGSLSTYGGFNQLTNAQVEKMGTVTVTQPTPAVLDGAGLDAWFAAPAIKYVQVEGTLSISGNYYNLTVEGAETAIGSLVGPTAEVMEGITNGSKVTVKGYAMYTSGGKYVNIVATSVTLVGEAVIKKDPTNTLETAYSVAQAIALIDGDEHDLSKKVYVKGIISAQLNETTPLIDLNFKNATFFISDDGTTESAQFEIYRGYDYLGQKFTEEKFKVGDAVVYFGSLTKYKDTYETNQGAELVLHNGKDVDAAGISAIAGTAAQGRTFDLQGRQVRATRGLYIVNGQKVIR